MKAHTTFLRSYLQTLTSVSFYSQQQEFPAMVSRPTDARIEAQKISPTCPSPGCSFPPSCHSTLVSPHLLKRPCNSYELMKLNELIHVKNIHFFLQCSVWPTSSHRSDSVWGSSANFKLSTGFTTKPTDRGAAASMTSEGLNSSSASKRAGKLTKSVSLLRMKKMKFSSYKGRYLLIKRLEAVCNYRQNTKQTSSTFPPPNLHEMLDAFAVLPIIQTFHSALQARYSCTSNFFQK